MADSIRQGARWVVALVLLAPRLAAAQAAGPAEFRVLQRGTELGRHVVSLEQSADGWLLTTTGRLGGEFNLHIKRFEAQYDRAWQPRFMSMELATPEDEALVHVAVVGTTTRTDIVRPGKEALFGANDVAPNTTFLPDYVFGAFEALAARLERAMPGTTLPYFVVPRLETRVRLERRQATTVTTTGGTRPAARWWLMVERDSPTPIEVWVSESRLLRIELPADEISVRRSDLVVP